MTKTSPESKEKKVIKTTNIPKSDIINDKNTDGSIDVLKKQKQRKRNIGDPFFLNKSHYYLTRKNQVVRNNTNPAGPYDTRNNINAISRKIVDNLSQRS